MERFIEGKENTNKKDTSIFDNSKFRQLHIVFSIPSMDMLPVPPKDETQ